MSKSRDEKYFHYWVIMGCYFKLDFTFYKVPRNNNGKMSLLIYINQILKSMIKS